MTAPPRARVPLPILLGSMVLLLAPSVHAQQVATSFEELRGLVQTGETIYVTDVSGVTIKGKLAGLSASSLELRGRSDALALPLRLSERDVNNIVVERSDSLWNGLLIGFLAGGVPVALSGLGASAPAGEVAGVAVGYGGIGLLTGLLIDVLNKEKVTIYVGAPGQRSPLSGSSPRSDVPRVGALRRKSNPASAARSFMELRLLVKTGDEVSVTDSWGLQWTGRVAELSDASLAIRVSGTRRDFPEGHVDRIESRGDPLWNGALIGLGVGAGIGLLAGRIAVNTPSTCSSPAPGACDFLAPLVVGAYLLTGMTVGTASGLATDALIRKRTLLYAAPGQSFSAGDRLSPMPSKAGLQMLPLLSRERTGVSIAIRF